MPLFEYACRSCDHQFESLVRRGDTPECPSCHGTELERRLSVFAAHSSSGSAAATPTPAGACGACGDPRGPGACSLN
jgi:putative FmdB family regulatory protein